MRTQKEIQHEIVALLGLKPSGPAKHRIASKIKLAVEELSFGFDMTSGEFSELSEDEQSIISTARNWKDGFSSNRPSQAWGAIIEPEPLPRRLFTVGWSDGAGRKKQRDVWCETPAEALKEVGKPNASIIHPKP